VFRNEDITRFKLDVAYDDSLDCTWRRPAEMKSNDTWRGIGDLSIVGLAVLFEMIVPSTLQQSERVEARADLFTNCQIQKRIADGEIHDAQPNALVHNESFP